MPPPMPPPLPPALAFERLKEARLLLLLLSERPRERAAVVARLLPLLLLPLPPAAPRRALGEASVLHDDEGEAAEAVEGNANIAAAAAVTEAGPNCVDKDDTGGVEGEGEP